MSKLSLTRASAVNMVSTRVYVPSRILIRALSRPLPSQCHLVRATPLHCRNAHSNARKDSQLSKLYSEALERDAHKSIRSLKKNIDSTLEEIKRLQLETTGESTDPYWFADLTDKEINDPDMPDIEFYERDLDKGGPDVLVKRIATPEDFRREREMWRMVRESEQNPDYDRYHLRRAMIDQMLVDPRYQKYAEMLKDMKGRLRTKEQLAEAEEMERKEMEEKLKELKSGYKTDPDGVFAEVLDTPGLEAARPELNAFLKALMEHENHNQHPEVLEAMERLEKKFSEHPDFKEVWAKLEDEVEQEREAGESVDDMKRNVEAEHERAVERAMAEAESDNYTPVLAKMRDVMAALGGSECEAVQAEINQLLSEKTELKEDEDDVEGFDYNALSTELTRLKKKPVEQDVDGNSHIDPSLQAKVNKILEDPDLFEKLVHLQRAIEDAKQPQSVPIDQISHELAPDPENLPAERTTPLQERIKMARDDPEHAAALANLHIDLTPPFNLSPALRAFNQAIELAYVGANDDIRRILWRAYMKVRTLPTFLLNVPDDVWDLLYYSQAVTWKTNRNRESHLALLLQDLESVGRPGPPTHPSTLANNS
ncbi:hypothetical protein DM02DRAFT_614395 [Periconia macrospinosa]|uniref:Uncharacterized protein n=1 Tax=Periconia macrospinosa TaxID=97972 RepID=A0A2V1DQ89_9PLEO|nr:hypothetical protein DM02DRAFT_614395 [Periconia macrospinosa]